MTANDIIEGLRLAGINHYDVETIAKGWNLNQSQATDKYMAMTTEQRIAACRRAVANVPCDFCGAAAGVGCCITFPHTLSKVLDGYAHCGRWMKYLIDEDLYDMLAPVQNVQKAAETVSAESESANSLKDMLS